MHAATRWMVFPLLFAGAVFTTDDCRAEKKAAAPVGLVETNWDGVLKLVAAHKGQVVVVDIWTTTCPGCLEKFPDFLALRKTHGKDVALISVNCDFDGIAKKPPKYYRDGVLMFLRKQKASCDNVMINIPFLPFLNHLKLESTPALFVYDKAGKLIKRFDNDKAVKEADEFTMLQVDTLVKELTKQK